MTGLCFQAFGEFDAAGFERKYPFREFGSPLWGSLEAFRRMLDDCRRAGHAERREGDSELYAAIRAAAGSPSDFTASFRRAAQRNSFSGN